MRKRLAKSRTTGMKLNMREGGGFPMHTCFPAIINKFHVLRSTGSCQVFREGSIPLCVLHVVSQATSPQPYDCDGVDGSDSCRLNTQAYSRTIFYPWVRWICIHAAFSIRNRMAQASIARRLLVIQPGSIRYGAFGERVGIQAGGRRDHRCYPDASAQAIFWASVGQLAPLGQCPPP